MAHSYLSCYFSIDWGGSFSQNMVHRLETPKPLSIAKKIVASPEVCPHDIWWTNPCLMLKGGNASQQKVTNILRAKWDFLLPNSNFICKISKRNHQQQPSPRVFINTKKTSSPDASLPSDSSKHLILAGWTHRHFGNDDLVLGFA